MAQDFGLKEPILTRPPYLPRIAAVLSAELAVREPGQAAVFLNRSMALIEDREWQAASPENLFPYTPRVLAGLLEENYQIAILTRNSGASVRQVFPDIDRYCHLFCPAKLYPGLSPIRDISWRPCIISRSRPEKPLWLGITPSISCREKRPAPGPSAC